MRATIARRCSSPRRPSPCAPAFPSWSPSFSPGGGRRPLPRRAQGPAGRRRAPLRAARRAALRQRRHPHRPRAEQAPEGFRGPLAVRARQGRGLRARLGLSRPAHRVEDRGGGPEGREDQGRGRSGRVPHPLPRLRRPLDRGADGRVQAPGRARRLGPPLRHDGLFVGSRDRVRIPQGADVRPPLPRLQARDVEPGGAHGAGGRGGGVPPAELPHDLGEVPGSRVGPSCGAGDKAGGLGSA